MCVEEKKVERWKNLHENKCIKLIDDNLTNLRVVRKKKYYKKKTLLKKGLLFLFFKGLCNFLCKSLPKKFTNLWMSNIKMYKFWIVVGVY